MAGRGRPKVPLISGVAVCDAALRVIDQDGLDALTLRRLGEELDVHAASLYYHFKNKEEILAAVVEMVLRDAYEPDDVTGPWTVWGLRQVEVLKRTLVEHPGLIPILTQGEIVGLGLGLSPKVMDAGAALFEREGVPVGAIAPLLEFGEVLAVAFAQAEIGSSSPDRNLPPEEFPHLHLAVREQSPLAPSTLAHTYLAGASEIIATVQRREQRAASAKEASSKKQRKSFGRDRAQAG